MTPWDAQHDALFDAAFSKLRDAFAKTSDPTISAAEKIRIWEDLLPAQRDLARFVVAHPDTDNPKDAARPLVDTLLMLASSVDSFDRPRADALRDEAKQWAQYLDAQAQIGLRSDFARAALWHGDFVVALDLMEEARELAEASGNRLEGARTIMERVNLLQNLNDYDAALAGVQQVRRMLQSGERDIDNGDPVKSVLRTAERMRLLFDVDFQTGLIQIGRGEFQEAADAISRAMKSAQAMGLATEPLLFYLAKIPIECGRPEEAEALLNASQSVVAAIGPSRLHVYGYYRARIALLRGQYDAAARQLEQARDAASAMSDTQLYAKASWSLANALSRKEPTAASSAFTDACEAVDRCRRAPLGYRLDNAFLIDKQPIVRDAIRWFADHGEGERAVGAMELVKSRRLSAALASPHVDEQRQKETASELLAVSRQMDAITLGLAPATDVEAAVTCCTKGGASIITRYREPGTPATHRVTFVFPGPSGMIVVDVRVASPSPPSTTEPFTTIWKSWTCPDGSHVIVSVAISCLLRAGSGPLATRTASLSGSEARLASA